MLTGSVINLSAPHAGYVAPGNRLEGQPTITLAVVSELVCGRAARHLCGC
jgi:hypothetical protein